MSGSHIKISKQIKFCKMQKMATLYIIDAILSGCTYPLINPWNVVAHFIQSNLSNKKYLTK